MKLNKWFASLIGAVVLALVVAACGGGSSAVETLDRLKESVAAERESLLAELNTSLPDDEKALIVQISDTAESAAGKLLRVESVTVSEDENRTIYETNSTAERYHFYGVMFANDHRIDMALYLFLKASQNDPDNALYLSEIVAMLVAGERSDRASDFAALAAELGLSQAEAAISLATYYEQVGKDDEAQSLYERAIEIDPKSPLIRQFFFQALARYKSLSDDLYALKEDATQYCEDTFSTLQSLDMSSASERTNFINEKTVDAVNFNTDFLSYASSYSGTHAEGARVISASTIEQALTAWQEDNTALSSHFSTLSDTAMNGYAECIAGCGTDISCPCSCINNSMTYLTEKANTDIKPEVIDTIGRNLPKTVYEMTHFEAVMLNYTLQNVDADDIASIVYLVKDTYATYKSACATMAVDYVTDQQNYFGFYDLADSLAASGTATCTATAPTKSTIEEAEQKVEEEADESGGDDLDNIFSDMKFEVCLGGSLLGGCFTYDKGVMSISMNSGPVTLSGSRDIIHGVGLGGSIGINGNLKLPYDIVNLSYVLKMNFDSTGDYKSVDYDVDAVTYVDTIKKAKDVYIFVYHNGD